MGFEIKDGEGSSRLAGVTDANRLKVESQTASRDFYVSRDKGTAFTVYAKTNAVDNNTNPIFYMEYTGSKKLYIKEMTFSSNSAHAKIEVYYDPSYTSGGAAVLPLNSNRGSSTPSDTTCYHGGTALVMTTTAVNEIFDVRLNVSSFTKDFQGRIILGKGDKIGIIGSVADYTVADRIRVVIDFYEE